MSAGDPELLTLARMIATGNKRRTLAQLAASLIRRSHRPCCGEAGL